MILLFCCPECGTHLQAEDYEAGGQTTCPDCQRSITVPGVSAETQCSSCKFKVRFSAEVAGKTFHCPDCETPLLLTADAKQWPHTPPRLKRDAPVTDTQPSPSAPQRRHAKRGFFEFAKKSWCIVDCLTANVIKIDKFPFELGSAEAVDLRLDDVAANHCALAETKQNRVCLAPRDPAAQALLNGIPVEESTQLNTETDYSLQVGNHFFILHGGKGVEKWVEGIDLEQWLVHQPQKNKTEGPMQLRAFGKLAASQDYDPHATIIYPTGTTMGFYLWQLKDALVHLDEQSGTRPVMADSAKAASDFMVSSDKGALL